MEFRAMENPQLHVGLSGDAGFGRQQMQPTRAVGPSILHSFIDGR